MTPLVGRFSVLLLQFYIYGLLLRKLEPLWAYQDIRYETPSQNLTALFVILLILVAACLPAQLWSPSSSILWWLATFVVTPTLAVSAFNPSFQTSIKMGASATVVLGLAIPSVLIRRLAPIRRLEYALSFTPKGFYRLILLLVVIAILTIVVGYGARFSDLSFGSQFERRLEARSLTPPFPGARYMVGWLKSCLIPLAVIFAWRERLRLAWSVAALGVVTIWAFDGQKSALVVPLVTLLLCLSYARPLKLTSGTLFGFSLTGLFLILPIVVTRIVPQLQLDVLVARRIGLVPGILTHTHVEFAETSGFTHFSQSWLKFLPDSGDTSSIGVRLGRYLDELDQTNANANLFVDGFASLGLWGVAMVSILFSLLLRLIDRIAASRDWTMACTLFGSIGTNFSDGYLHTSLLTYGLLLGVVLMIFAPANPMEPVTTSTEMVPPISPT